MHDHIRAIESYHPAELDEIEGWARAGRPDLILQDLHECPSTSPWRPPPPNYLWKAFDQASQRSPEYLMAANFQEMLAARYRLVARLDYVLEKYLRLWDQYNHSPDGLHYIAGTILPLLEEAQRSYLQLFKAYSAAKRSLDLPEWPEILAARAEPAQADPMDGSADLPAAKEGPQVQATGKPAANGADPQMENATELRVHHE